MEFLVEVGTRIKNLRKKLNLTQEELAQKSGYTSRSSINKVEKGLVDLPRSKIIEIAEALHTTPGYLMGWEEDSNIINVEKNPPEEPKLSEGDAEWLSLFRAIPEDLRDEAVQYVRSALKIAGLLQ